MAQQDAVVEGDALQRIGGVALIVGGLLLVSTTVWFVAAGVWVARKTWRRTA